MSIAGTRGDIAVVDVCAIAEFAWLAERVLDPAVLVGDTRVATVDHVEMMLRKHVRGAVTRVGLVMPTGWGEPRRAVLRSAAWRICPTVDIVDRITAIIGVSRVKSFVVEFIDGEILVSDGEATIAFSRRTDVLDDVVAFIAQDPLWAPVRVVAHDADRIQADELARRIRVTDRSARVMSDDVVVATALDQLAPNTPTVPEPSWLDSLAPEEHSTANRTWQLTAAGAIALCAVLIAGWVWLRPVHHDGSEHPTVAEPSPPVLAAQSTGVRTPAPPSTMPSVAPAPDQEIAVGRVRLTVPGAWRVSGDGNRLTVSDPDSTANLTIAVADLAKPLTNDQLAADLVTLIGARTDVFTTVVPHARYADRSVVSYRELRSQRNVDWYVQILGWVQVSVGCDAGDWGDSMAPVCAAAVGSVRV